jgi:hypothetical protein
MDDLIWQSGPPPEGVPLLTLWRQEDGGGEFYHLVNSYDSAGSRTTSICDWWPGRGEPQMILVRWVALPPLEDPSG